MYIHTHARTHTYTHTHCSDAFNDLSFANVMHGPSKEGDSDL